MKLISLLLLLSYVVNSMSLVCRPNCAVCDPINNGTCLQCIDNKWGNMCQNTCMCEDTCDVDTGNCIIYVVVDTKNQKNVIYIKSFIFLVMLTAFGTFMYKVLTLKHISKH